jgi:signal peptidase II
MFGQVVDMFYFPLFDYKLPWMEYPRTFFGAVFNFADSCVSCGAIYLMLFQWKFFSSEEKSKSEQVLP